MCLTVIVSYIEGEYKRFAIEVDYLLCKHQNRTTTVLFKFFSSRSTLNLDLQSRTDHRSSQ